MTPSKNVTDRSCQINALATRKIKYIPNSNIPALIRVHCKIINPIKIPPQIARTVPMLLIGILQSDGRGYSFNSDTSLQLTYVHNGIDLGGIYSLSNYGSWYKAWSAAYERKTNLEILYPINESTFPPLRGVRLLKRRRKGCTIAEFKWQVSFYRNGVEKTKSFYCGNENTVTVQRNRHAELTARHFGKLYCQTLDPEVFSNASTQGWQTKKYYEVDNG